MGLFVHGNRFFQSLLVFSTIGFSWLAMMAVHEFGHVLHAWFSCGVVESVVLDPLSFSQTFLADNPHPLFVVWGGPLWGCIIPMLFYGVVHWMRWTMRYLAAFFAGFCLIANGAYIGGGSFIGAGDAGDMLRHGSPQWLLIVFGVSGVALGLWSWNGLGPYFGLGPAKGNVDRRAAIVMMAAFVILFGVELTVSLGIENPW